MDDYFALEIEATKADLKEKHGIERFVTKSSKHGYWVIDEKAFLKMTQSQRVKLLDMWKDRLRA